MINIKRQKDGKKKGGREEGGREEERERERALRGMRADSSRKGCDQHHSCVEVTA